MYYHCVTKLELLSILSLIDYFTATGRVCLLRRVLIFLLHVKWQKFSVQYYFSPYKIKIKHLGIVINICIAIS